MIFFFFGMNGRDPVQPRVDRLSSRFPFKWLRDSISDHLHLRNVLECQRKAPRGSHPHFTARTPPFKGTVEKKKPSYEAHSFSSLVPDEFA